jgi:hypothetical protein
VVGVEGSPVRVAGMTGPHSTKINGIYGFADHNHLTATTDFSMSHKGFFKTLLKKTNDDVWIQLQGSRLILCDGQNLNSGNGFIFCDVDPDVFTDSEFHSNFSVVCAAQNYATLWYSAQNSLFGSSNVVKEVHPRVFMSLVTSVSFTGVYRASDFLTCGMPEFVLNGPDTLVMQKCCGDAVWVIKHRSSDQVLAVSQLSSSQFPIVWAPVEHSSSAPLPPSSLASSAPSLHLSSAFCAFGSLPDVCLSLFVAPVIACPDASLFEGNYRLCDIVPMKTSHCFKIFYSHAESGCQLKLKISSLQICSASLEVDGDVLFLGVITASSSQELLSLLLSRSPAFSMNLFRTPLDTHAAPAFRVTLTQNPRPPSAKVLLQPGMMPLFSSPSCVTFVKNMMSKDCFDYRSFWKQVLVQMSGSAELTDHHSLHRTLVSSPLIHFVSHS